MDSTTGLGPSVVVMDGNKKDEAAAIETALPPEPNLTMTMENSSAGFVDDALSFWDISRWNKGELPRLLALSGTRFPTGFSQDNGRSWSQAVFYVAMYLAGPEASKQVIVQPLNHADLAVS